MRPADMRASHTDRDRVVAVLRTAAEDGRLDLHEFEERLDRVHRARTLGALAPITGDLVPDRQQPIQVDGPPQVIALLADAHRSGRWVVQAHQPVLAAGASATLDLREALLERDTTVVTATAVFGRITMHVPDGVEVRVSGWSFLGRRHTTVRRPRTAGDRPVLHVQGFCVFGSVDVLAPRRSLRPPWLRRER